jgi:hypothetical protein
MFATSSQQTIIADINLDDRLVHDGAVGSEETINHIQQSVRNDYAKRQGCGTGGFSLSSSLVSCLWEKYSWMESKGQKRIANEKIELKV